MPPVKEVKYMDIAHVFKPYEQTVEISLQMPEDWNYILWDVEEESPDWGYSVKVQGREDAIFSIFGQHGTLTDDSSNGPKSFRTSQGMTGQYSWENIRLMTEILQYRERLFLIRSLQASMVSVLTCRKVFTGKTEI